jgi:hypothetical protein
VHFKPPVQLSLASLNLRLLGSGRASQTGAIISHMVSTNGARGRQRWAAGSNTGVGREIVGGV